MKNLCCKASEAEILSLGLIFKSYFNKSWARGGSYLTSELLRLNVADLFSYSTSAWDTPENKGLWRHLKYFKWIEN